MHDLKGVALPPEVVPSKPTPGEQGTLGGAEAFPRSAVARMSAFSMMVDA